MSNFLKKCSCRTERLGHTVMQSNNKKKVALTRILRRHRRDHSFGVQWDRAQEGEILSVVVVADGSNVLSQDEVSSFPVLHP